MKWLLLALWMALCPVIAVHLKKNPRHMRWAAFAMGFTPMMMTTLHLYVAPISRPYWVGPIKGVEVSALDFLALAIIIAAPRGPAKLAVLWPWLLYLAAILIAVAQPNLPTLSLYYAWQVARAMLIFYAATRLAQYPRAIEAMLGGLFVATIYQMIASVVQSQSGVLQAGGTVGTQNLLGMLANFALCTSLALILRGKQGVLPVLGFGAAVIIDILTASRATLGFGAIGLGFLLVCSCARSFSGRKGAILGLVVLVSAAATPIAMSSIAERKQGNSTESSNRERQAFKHAAWMIIEDHPLGIGANQYTLIANVGGYSARAGVNWNTGSRATSVHDSYLLVLAETSVLGLIGMLAVIVMPIFVSLRGAFRNRRDPRGELLLGLGLAITTFAMHLNYEWIFVTSTVQYLFAMVAGSAIGLALLIERERAESRRERRQAKTPPTRGESPSGDVPKGAIAASVRP